MIRNIENNRRYIGQTVRHPRIRFKEHALSLEQRCHNNSRLQKDYNIYGSDAFVFSILEKVHISDLDEREKYWIEQSNSFYQTYNVESNYQFWTNKYE